MRNMELDYTGKENMKNLDKKYDSLYNFQFLLLLKKNI